MILVFQHILGPNEFKYDNTETPPFKWMVEGATTTALALGSKWQEQLLELVTTNLGWFLGRHNHHQAGPGAVIFLQKYIQGEYFKFTPEMDFSR